MTRTLLLAGGLALMSAVAFAQTAGDVERCFQNPAACPGYGGGGAATPAPAPGPAPQPPVAATRQAAPAPDYATVLNSPEPDRRKIQESLRILDKYNGPIDGNLQSEATTKAIAAWQKGRNTAATGKLTPPEAQALNAEAARVPIRRIDPSTQVATAATPGSGQSNADALKALKARLAERRKAAEPKAEAATQALIRDLKAYVAAAGRGVAGEQFTAFAKWYTETKSSGRQFGDITPAIEDYGDAKAGAAATAEVNFKTMQGEAAFTDCLVFAWIEGNTRRNAQAFSCNDVAAVEKWKTEQALRSAWR